MNATNHNTAIAITTTPFTACNKDNPPPHTLEKGKCLKSGSEEKSVEKNESKRKKGIPKAIYIITDNESKSKDVVAKAMAEMYKRMLNPV